ncbi:MAG TPA: CsbD family protein [Longimicrobium sp.]|nr:CsbD family protein [Longimicrobium sp.]
MEDKDLTQRGLENSVEGKTTDLKGKIKDAVGGLTGDTSLQGEGKLDQLKGKVQDAFGQGQRKLDENV